MSEVEKLEQALELCRGESERMRRELLMGLISTIRYAERLRGQPIGLDEKSREQRYRAFVESMKELAGKYTRPEDILR